MDRWQNWICACVFSLPVSAGGVLACPAPNSGELAAIGEVRKAASGGMPSQAKVRFCGQITIRPGDLPDDPDNFYIQDATGGVSVISKKPPKFSYGTWVLVEGKPRSLDTIEPEIEASKVSYAGPGRMPQPRIASAGEVRSGKLDGWHVSVTGRVVQLSTNEIRDDLVLSDGSGAAEAYCRRPRGTPVLVADLTPIGAHVEIRGVVLPTSSGVFSRIRFRNPQDVLLIAKPGLFETPKGRFAALMALFCVLAGTGWIVTLRRSVKRQTAEIRKLLDVAEEAARLKSEFVANMSHEIRTPLHAVIGLQQMALDEDSAERRRIYLEQANNASTHLLALLNNVLDLAALDRDAAAISQERMSPAQILLEAIGMFEVAAEARGLKLECVDGGLPEEVFGDPIRVKQILVNLLSNAVKFTSEGSITVRASAESEPDEWRLRFEVADTGIGIAGEHLQEIFEEFRQADGSVRRNFGGSGLGLALATRLVQMMGGKLEVESREGHGSTFRFDIRCGKICNHEALVADRRENVKDAAGLNLLLVEDNRLNQVVAIRLLEKDGHRVQVAENGLMALAAYAESRFDAILMDVQMPVMDGLSAVREIRRMEAPGAHVPILAMTAHTSGHDRRACEAAGMDGMLSKPFNADQLRMALQKLMAAPAGDLTGTLGD